MLLPSLVWHTRHINPVYFHCFLLYYPFFLFFFLFYSTGETAAGDKPGGRLPHTKRSVNVGNGNPLRSASSRSVKGRRGCHLTFPDQSPMVPTDCTRCRRRCAASPNAHPGLSLVHWTSGMAGALGWCRPSGRCNVGYLTWCCWSIQRFGWRRTHKISLDTMWLVRRHVRPVPGDIRATSGWWGGKGLSSRVLSPHATTGRTW